MLIFMYEYHSDTDNDFAKNTDIPIITLVVPYFFR